MRRALTALVGLAATFVSVAGEPRMDRRGGPPESVASGLRGRVSGQGLAASLDGKVIAEFWIGRDVVAREDASPRLGVAFTGLEEGALLGIVRLTADWSDYKGTRVGAGIYALRYAVQPVDGNHMGVSLYRDFAVLIPAAVDQGGGVKDRDAVIEGGRAATGTTHPASMALFPVPDKTEIPAVVPNEIGQWMLAAKVGPFRVGFVVRGEGEH